MAEAMLKTLLDRSSEWHKALPPEECSFKKTEMLIPLPDGHLAADLYQPEAHSRGLLYALGCYGRGSLMAMLNAQIYALRGYSVLLVSSRGTFGSSGTFVPGMSEQTDSQAVVRWMREQPWYPGRFATIGASYLGYTQWALLRDPPQDLAACVIQAAPHDHARHTWTNGLFRMDRIGWNYMVATMEEEQANLSSREETRAVYSQLPLLEATERHFDGRAPHMRAFMTTPDIGDPYWNPVRHDDSLDKVDVPVLLFSGWYDPFVFQTFEQYRRLCARGCSLDLTVGAWSHAEASGMKNMGEVFDFLDEHLAGGKARRNAVVKAFVTGAEEWRDMPCWPPATEPRTFHLHRDRILAMEVPEAGSSASFVYDPADPTPTIGGGLLSGGGRKDDSAFASRSDVLVYTSAPLDADLEMAGKPAVQLAHLSDVPFADLWVRLSEVGQDGVSRNVCENFTKVDESVKDGNVVTLALHDAAHRFKKNTRVRLILAGGSFPLLARNPGFSGNPTLAKEMRPVTHTLAHGPQSKLVLPCVTNWNGEPA